MQCTSYHNFLHKKIPYLHALQGNREMGARYLDPKYSRWISVDPALGEYVPAAGKANAKDVGGIPGMGGLFNGVNLNLFHYAGNNPIKYIDPDGRTVFIDGSEETNLKAINKYSYTQYAIDDDGYLCKTTKVNKKGSTLYSEAIDRCIADENSEIIIRLSSGVDYAFGIEEENPILTKERYGGGATIYNDNEKDPTEIYIFFMKKGRSADGKWNAPIEQVLMHEIVGHADPIAAGGSRDNENAVENENKVLAQLKRFKQMREADPCHTAR